MTATATDAKIPETTQQTNAPATARPRSRRGRQSEDSVPPRYFLAKDGASFEKPELGAEVATEGDALIKAFQTKNGLLYAVIVYKAEAEIEGGVPTLVKRPVKK